MRSVCVRGARPESGPTVIPHCPNPIGLVAHVPARGRGAFVRQSAAAMADRFLLEGFVEGYSPMHRQAVSIDRDAYGLRRCSCYRRGGLAYRVFSKGERMKGLLDCPACGAGEEV